MLQMWIAKCVLDGVLEEILPDSTLANAASHVISGGAQLDLGFGKKPLNNITPHPHSGTGDTLLPFEAVH